MDNVLIVGDVHIGKGSSLGKYVPGSLYNGRVLDQINLLNWILLTVEEQDVSCVIFTGDIFEDWKSDYYLIEIFVDFIKKLSNMNVEIHIAVGNHDFKRVGSNYSSPLYFIDSLDIENVFVHQTVSTFYIKNSAFTILPFFDRKSLNCSKNSDALNIIQSYIDFESESIPVGFKKILVGHLAIEGAFYVGDEIDDSLNELFCPVEFFKNYDYTWMGHVHKPQILSTIPHVAHVGSLDFSGFEEAYQNKISILFDAESGKYKEISNPCRPLKHITVDVLENENPNEVAIKFLDTIPTLKNAIVRFEMNMEPSALRVNRNEIEEKINSLGAYYLCNFIEKRKPKQNQNTSQQTAVVSTDPIEAVKNWSKKILSDEDRELYLQYARETIEKLKK